MLKRFTQAIATAGTLGAGIILGSMMLSPTSAAPTDPDEGSVVANHLSSFSATSGLIVAEGPVDGRCSAFASAIEVPEGLDHEHPPDGLPGEDLHDQMVFLFASTEDLADVPVAPDIGQGFPTPPIDAPSPRISVVEKDGKVVVSDEDGNVLLETDASTDGIVGFQIEDGVATQIDPEDMPPLPDDPFRSAGGTGCGLTGQIED